jgi:hypothetical protein
VVVSFLTAHLGNPIPSPAILQKIGTAFRRAVASFAKDNRIALVRLARTTARSMSCGGIWPGKRAPVGRV